jgi:hypothetical protein
MMDAGRVCYYLDLWRDFMKINDNKLGYKSKSTGFMSGGMSSFEDFEDNIDNENAKTVYQVVNDLPTLPKKAIYILYLGEKSTMNDMLLEQSYDTAMVMLQKRLPEKNLY